MKHKIKIDLAQAAMYRNAGLDIECYLVIAGTLAGPKVKGKRTARGPRGPSTKDSSLYSMNGAVTFTVGSDLQIAASYIEEVFKHSVDFKLRRLALTKALNMTGWPLDKKIRNVSDLRRRGFLILEEV